MFTEDFGIFINPDTPGYRKMLVDYDLVEGVFDDEYVEDVFTESSIPVFYCATADIPGIEQGHSVSDEAMEECYEIVNVQPDSSGLTQLKLMLQ